MRRGRGWAVVAVLSMLALAGCTGSTEDPPTTPSPTSPAASPSETPSPTPTPDAAIPPERPDMSVVDAATAEAVARYFLELYPYVYATGDLTEWKALSHPECIFCASVADNVTAIAEGGGHAEGGALVADVSAAEISPGYFAVQGTATQAPGAEYDSEGGLLEKSDGGDYELAIVVLAEDGWVVRAVEFRTPEG